MLEGVTVVEKTEIFKYKAKKIYLYSLFVVALFGIATLIISFMVTHPIITILEFSCILVGLGFFFFPVFSSRWEEKIPTGRYKYIATIAPEVSFTELTNLYNVSKNKDGTYTLKEKEGVTCATGN